MKNSMKLNTVALALVLLVQVQRSNSIPDPGTKIERIPYIDLLQDRSLIPPIVQYDEYLQVLLEPYDSQLTICPGDPKKPIITEEMNARAKAYCTAINPEFEGDCRAINMRLHRYVNIGATQPILRVYVYKRLAAVCFHQNRSVACVSRANTSEENSMVIWSIGREQPGGPGRTKSSSNNSIACTPYGVHAAAASPAPTQTPPQSPANYPSPAAYPRSPATLYPSPAPYSPLAAAYPRSPATLYPSPAPSPAPAQYPPSPATYYPSPAQYPSSSAQHPSSSAQYPSPPAQYPSSPVASHLLPQSPATRPPDSPEIDFDNI